MFIVTLGMGNFIDGLSIGASISQNLTLGVTNALACWLGNIPQELGYYLFFNCRLLGFFFSLKILNFLKGDFALLVRAGMTPFQALFYNFIRYYFLNKYFV